MKNDSEPETRFCKKCGKPYMKYKGINVNMSCSHIHSFVKYLDVEVKTEEEK